MRIVILFLITSTYLFSNSINKIDPLVSVEECVHALTGELCLQCEDPITENIAMQRAYLSTQGRWNYFPHSQLRLIERTKKVKKKKKKKKKKEKPKFSDIVVVADSSGHMLTFRQLGTENYVLELPRGVTNTADDVVSAKTNLQNFALCRTRSSSFSLVCPDGTARIYQKSHDFGSQNIHFLLQEERLSNGQIRKFEYDTSHRIQMITYGAESCTFQYQPNNDFTIINGMGNTICYHMELNHHLSTIKGDEIQEEYEYLGNRLQRCTYAEKTLLIEYGNDNKVRALKDALGKNLHTFTYLPNQTEVVHSKKGKTTYFFSPLFFPEKIEEFSLKHDLIQTTNLSWNRQGELLKKTLSDGKGHQLSSQTFEYDPSGNPISENVNGENIHREFDTQNRLVKETAQSTYSYEYLGNTDLVTAKIDQAGISAFYEYGENASLKKVTIKEGNRSRAIEINGGSKWPISVVERGNDKLLRIALYTYSPNGILQEIYDAYGSVFLRQKIKKSELERTWEKIHPMGIHYEEGFEVERDFFGRVTAKRKYDEERVLLLEERWEYDIMHLLAYIDPTGLITNYFYDKGGLKEKESIRTSQGDVETLFFFDDAKRVKRIQKGALVTCFIYDDQDRIFIKQEEDLRGNLISKVFFSYETGKVIAKKQMSNGSFIPQAIENPSPASQPKEPPGLHQNYDSLDRLCECFTDDETVHYTISYNKRGQPTHIVDHVHNREGTRIYDELGNLIEETLLNGQTIKNTYDLQSRRVALLLPDDSSIFYLWGPKYLEEIYRTQKKYDYRHLFTHYDLIGFPTKQRLIEEFGEISYTFDNKMRIAEIHSQYSNQNSESVTQKVTKKNVPLYEYKCDGLGRIVEIKQPHRIISFTYDIWNRRMSKKVQELDGKKWIETLSWDFLYDDQTEIGVMDTKENWIRQLRICSPHPINPGDDAIAYELEGMAYAPIYDLYGNLHKLLSVIRGKEMETYFFSPSGNEKIIDIWGDPIPFSKARNPWHFGCNRLDEETGLLFIDGDYYDPNQEAFLMIKPHKELASQHLFKIPKRCVNW